MRSSSRNARQYSTNHKEFIEQIRSSSKHSLLPDIVYLDHARFLVLDYDGDSLCARSLSCLSIRKFVRVGADSSSRLA